jgi:octanoyl-[GcvH]:protein N-octanoyltransferase
MFVEDHVRAAHPLAAELRRDEFLAEELGRPVARLYVIPRGLAAGPRDRRLPRFGDAWRTLAAEGVDLALRSSGGQAVGLTDGVLNVSLAWPGAIAPGLEDAFRRLTLLLVDLLSAFGLAPTTGEVEGAFCPGRTDIAVQGRKVAGLSQRRRRGAVCVHGFLLLADPSPFPLVQRFYHLAGGEAPPLHQDAMAPLSLLLGERLSPCDLVPEITSRVASFL